MLTNIKRSQNEFCQPFIMVSIITPCYNSENFVSATIESVLSQTYVNWEMIIVDDCSTDTSPLIVMEYVAKDSRIKYVRTNIPSGSPTYPRNVGLEVARGRFVAFLDSDDLWFPSKLETQMSMFNDDNVALVYSNYEKIREDGTSSNRIVIASKYHHYRSLLYGNEIGCLTVIIDTHKTGKIDFKYIGHEDYECWLSILRKGYIAKNCNKVLAAYRVRKSSLSSNKFKTVRWVWNIYRNYEHMDHFSTFYHLLCCMLKSVVKYIK